MSKRKSANAKCLRPGCERYPVSRGLCKSDYQTARTLVAEQRTTWEKLEAAGKCLGPADRKSNINWFLKE